MCPDLKLRLPDGSDAEIAQYRALSGLAVAGLVLGLLSPLWMIDPLLWLLPVPPLGILLSALALRQIRLAAPVLVGRRAALVGLLLSVFFGAAAPANWLCYRWAIRREARQFAHQWFDLLAHDRPQQAYQLTQPPKYRPLLGGNTLQGLYRAGSPARKALDDYVSRQLIRTLLALGERAQVRYYQTDGFTHTGQKDVIFQTYAVTYHDPTSGEKKTFFVSLHMERVKLDTGRAGWQLMRTEDGFKPEGL
jgi:hypothetical protein